MKWWTINLKAIRRDFKGQLYTQYHNKGVKQFADKHGIQAVEGINHGGIGEDKIHHHSNSGAQAINLAYLLGATRIILLGYDMGQTGGKNHWFGNHPKGMTNGNYKGFVPRFDSIAEDAKAKGVEIINCTRQTNLTQFPQASIDDIF